MASDDRNVTRLTVGREEWRKMESEETGFILRETRSPYGTVAFVFSDASTGIHVGNAVVVSETPFGDYEGSPWTWSMFAKLTDTTVRELKERFPAEAGMENPSACAMYLYEIRPVGDEELLRRLCDK